jgi:hypothetical protein
LNEAALPQTYAIRAEQGPPEDMLRPAQPALVTDTVAY